MVPTFKVRLCTECNGLPGSHAATCSTRRPAVGTTLPNSAAEAGERFERLRTAIANAVSLSLTCFVLGCCEPIERVADGSPARRRHRRFGIVVSCAGHNPEGGRS